MSIRFDKALSDKLKIVSLISIFLVMVNHVTGNMLPSKELVYNATRPNRVLFFGVAGFLFTFGFPFLKERLFQKWNDRMKTLLIPYLLTFAIAKAVVVVYVLSVPRAWLARSEILSGLWNDGHIRWTGLLTSGETEHLWFLEGLMLAVVVYGALLVSTRWNRAFHVALVVASIAFFFKPPSRQFEALLFFGVGTLLARLPSLLTSAGPGRVWTGVLGAAWIGCIWGYLAMTIESKSGMVGRSFVLVHSYVGAVFLWWAIDWMPAAFRRILGPFCPYVFPIYLIHIFVLVAARRLIGRGIWDPFVGTVPGLFLLALLCTCLTYLLVRSIETAFPSFAALWFGGRGAARGKAALPAKAAPAP